MARAAAGALPRATGSRRLAPLRRRLLAWYRRNRRDLPWRRTRDPYAIHVSEVMLQQTTVAAVVPYYERFLARFPDAGALARAREDAVVRLFAGLGYYHRARRLRAAVREVERRWGGRYPDRPEDLRRLPGVGEYTAAALASIAFGRPAAVVDGNVERVMARIFGLRGAAGSGALRRDARARAASLLDRRAPGDFNQALMELGAMVCTPRNPRCGRCPAARACRARALGRPERFPSPAVRRATVRVHRAAALVVERGRLLLRRIPRGAINAGLLELPGGDVRRGEAPADALAAALGEAHGLRVDVGVPLGRVSHAITHHRISVDVFAAARRSGRVGAPLVFVPRARLAGEALTSATRKALRAAGDVLGYDPRPSSRGRR